MVQLIATLAMLAITGIVIGTLVLAATLILTLRRADETLKLLKASKDHDERGPYNDAVDQIQENVHFNVREFLRKGHS
jgi:hypothetical protein